MSRWASCRGQLLMPALIALALALGSSACRRQNAAPPPPPPPPPVVAAPAPPPPPPPPPPKCESLEEQCTAEDSTRIEIGDSGIDYAPPVGWNYVKGEDHSRALESHGAAVVGFAVVPENSPKEVLAAAEKLRAVLELDGVKIDRLKKRLKKSQQKLQGPHGVIDLWEITAHTQGGTTPVLRDRGAGTALLARANVATEREVVVLGFVVEPDDNGQAAQIMKAVESLMVKQ